MRGGGVLFRCGWVCVGAVVCSVHVHVLVYCVRVMFVHCLWTQCGVVLLLQSIEYCLFVMLCVHMSHFHTGPGFVSMSPESVSRSLCVLGVLCVCVCFCGCPELCIGLPCGAGPADRHLAGYQGRSAEKTAGLGSPFGEQGWVVSLCSLHVEGGIPTARRPTLGGRS